MKATLYGGVAQLGEHLPCKQGVMGSIPIISTKPTEWAAKIGEVSKKPADIARWEASGKRTETSEAKGDSNQRP